MPKTILMVFCVIIFSTACATQRDFSAPNRPNTKNHRQMKYNKECLKCHEASIPHFQLRGECIKCHLIEGE